ncbi:MAG: hypothetical protein OEL79_01690 [Chromatiales bacterium]|nr:hypothetical protein [Chromatiales bacterium]
MAEHYVVAYNGQLAEGKTLEVVKQGVAQLFKVDVAKIEHLFTGQWGSIKKGVDEATAKKYQGALAKMGAICKVVTEAQFAELSSAPAVEAKPDPAMSEKPQAKVTMTEDTGLLRSVVKEAPAGLGGLEGISVEENWDQLETHDNTPPPQVDLSGVAMAEVGAELTEHQDIPDLEVDLSEITLDALGVDMSDHQEPPALDVDTSEMILDEPGVTIVEHKPVVEPEIDISKISLE